MFRQGSTCPALLNVVHPTALSYTGLSPSLAALSRAFYYRRRACCHWAVPRSLATTDGISVDFFSSGY